MVTAVEVALAIKAMETAYALVKKYNKQSKRPVKYKYYKRRPKN